MITFKEAKEILYPNTTTLTTEQNEEIRQYAISHFSAKTEISAGKTVTVPVMKCDLCGKTFPMSQLEHDNNFGYVCKKCENKVTC